MSATKLKVSLCALPVLIGAMLVTSAAPANAASTKNSQRLCSFQQSQSREDQHLYFEIYYGDYCAVYRVTATLRGVSTAAEFGHSNLPVRMVGVKTLESQAAAMILRVVFTMVRELTARYRISMEVAAGLGVQHFGDTTVMEVLSRSGVPRASSLADTKPLKRISALTCGPGQ
jgi:hypothetical protein